MLSTSVLSSTFQDILFFSREPLIKSRRYTNDISLLSLFNFFVYIFVIHVL